MTNRTTLLAATALASAATAALALPGAARAQAPAPAVNGLYIAGSAGANFLEDQRTRARATNGATPILSLFNRGYDPGPVGLGSVGYGFGNGLRVELEGSYRYNRTDGRRFSFDVSNGGREEKYGPMVNAFYDIPVSFVVQPYLGVGVGYQWARLRAQEVNVSQGTSGVLVQSEYGGTRGSFAVQAMAGVAFNIDAVPGLALTAEYRFMDLTDRRNYGGPISVPGYAFTARVRNSTSDDYNHVVLIGLRYAFNTAAPPPAPIPTPIPPGPVSSARTFLVFFDWDRADLTPRARQIIAEAARSAQSTQTTRIEVAGHTDLSGTARYNQGLSIRRANAVAAELVRDGVPRGAIVTQGFGESRPLVPTAQGVREPQNRRVEIVLR